MSENEYLEEEMDADIQSQDEYQEEDPTIEEDQEEESEEDAPRKESFVQKLRRENKELKKQLKSQPEKSSSTDIETRLFFIENEDAKPFKDEFLKVQEQYPELSFDDALELAKTRKPKESKTVKEGFQGGGYRPKPKSIEQLSENEALDLPPEKYAEYLKKTGKIM